jgi:hypothetical protein
MKSSVGWFVRAAGVFAYVGGYTAIEPSMPEPRSRLVLIDGAGYIFRAFFALPPLTNPNGVEVLVEAPHHKQSFQITIRDCSQGAARNI